MQERKLEFTLNKSLKAASLDSPNRRMLRIVRAVCSCPLAQRYIPTRRRAVPGAMPTVREIEDMAYRKIRKCSHTNETFSYTLSALAVRIRRGFMRTASHLRVEPSLLCPSIISGFTVFPYHSAPRGW
jgi:hypothetical protein